MAGQTSSQANAITATSRHGLFYLWVGLVAIVVAGSLAYGPNSSPHFWLWWEGGALITATLYTIVFYCRLFVQNDNADHRIHKGLGDWLGLVVPLCICAVACLLTATIITFHTSYGTEMPKCLSVIYLSCNENTVPIIFLSAGGLFFCSIDLIFASKHDNEEIRREFWQGFLFNGMPVTFAFLILLAFVCRFNNDDMWNGHDLRLMSVAASEDLLDVGRNLIIVAFVGADLHIRIFDSSRNNILDKTKSELISGELLMALENRLNPFPDESSLSKEDKQEIIRNATSIAGYPLWNASLKTFIGGAIAFQMLLSNTIFAILFWKPKGIVEGETTWVKKGVERLNLVMGVISVVLLVAFITLFVKCLFFCRLL